jgi:poly(A) polymerase
VTAASLPRRWPPAWVKSAETRASLAALAAAGIEARFVGGAVRDSLLGRSSRSIDDIDLATPARPEAVLAALQDARIVAVPTGIAHGTVTAVFARSDPPRRYEITTLRRDVETDGRHAVVAFDADWAGDAARRDFTINAIYLAPDGALFDPVGGRDDLAAHRVRFVGDPAQRIAEDRLRLLRYYRFEARFGAGAGNEAARAACRAAAGQTANLSAERVAREILGLLRTPRPIRALEMMREDGVLAAILPEATRIDRLERLIDLDAPTPTLPRKRGRESAKREGGAVSDPLLRLAALIEVDQAGAAALAVRLHLSRGERDRLAGLAPPWSLDPAADIRAQRRALYRLGSERYRDIAQLVAAEGRIAGQRLADMLALAEGWTPPAFPLKGDDVTALGIAPGPKVGRLLAAVERWWEAGDFSADRAQSLARLGEIAGSE